MKNTVLANLWRPKMKKLGITHATLTKLSRTIVNFDPTGRVKMSDASGAAGGGRPAFGAVGTAKRSTKGGKPTKFEKIDKTTFKLEFAWIPKPPSARQAEEDAAAATASQPGEGSPMPGSSAAAPAAAPGMP